MASATATSGRTRPRFRIERRDAWWAQPLSVILFLGSFGVYAFWAAWVNADYYVEPYLSPLYSPCIAANCVHQMLPIVGQWWTLSPAFLILWVPLGFRATCYYYRKSYYRSFFWSPPACAVPDAAPRYSGETSFPLIFQNAHRYFFWLILVVTAFLWWDTLLAFKFPSGFGIGVGSLIFLVNVILLTLYTLSCHSCRHLCGGGLNLHSAAPLRHRLWMRVSRLNEKHGQYAWFSMLSVALTDVYVRLVATGTIVDFRIL